MLTIMHGDNLSQLRKIKQSSIDMIYIDPPFNTGVTQKSVVKYDNVIGMYEDSYSDYVDFLKSRLILAWHCLKPTGSILVHLDYREVHYIKVEMDKIFGRSNFMNEIIWAYDYGARQKTKWPTKHDTILWYVQDKNNYTFNYDDMDRIPYIAPGLCGKAKAARGKTPTDVWFITVCPTNGKERTGYPTQKPMKLLERLVKIHSNPGDIILDFFAGSGTTGHAALKHGRDCILIDKNEEAIRVIQRRLKEYKQVIIEGE